MLTHTHIQTQAHAKLALLNAHDRDASVYDAKLFLLFFFFHYATQHFFGSCCFFFGSSAADDDKEHTPHTRQTIFRQWRQALLFLEMCSASHCVDFHRILAIPVGNCSRNHTRLQLWTTGLVIPACGSSVHFPRRGMVNWIFFLLF